jgi:hypothetical protein
VWVENPSKRRNSEFKSGQNPLKGECFTVHHRTRCLKIYLSKATMELMVFQIIENAAENDLNYEGMTNYQNL